MKPSKITINHDKKSRFSWCLFDWANSAFPTVIVTFVFSTYFVTNVAQDEVTGTAQWGLAVSISGLIIALLSPFLGAISGKMGQRKVWLGLFSLITIFSAGVLWFVRPEVDYVVWALIAFAVANIGFEVGQVFYNALLPAIAPRQLTGRLSGWGWGMGYGGGLCCLLISLFIFVQGNPPPLGLDAESAEHVRVVGPIVALWFAIFSLPLFVFVREPIQGNVPLYDALRAGTRSLLNTIRNIREYRHIAWFFLARLLYVDGMNTMFVFGGIYAAGTFGMGIAEVMEFGVALNVSAGLGAIGFAWLDDKLGARNIVLLALSGLVALGIPLLIIESKLWFWIIGLLLGLFMGPAQSASRSLMVHLAPVSLQTEMFGLYALSGKATAFVGPLILGFVTLASGSQRIGMVTVLVLIAGGLVVVFWKVRLSE
ncbi:MAG: MFS transporter [Pseudomonadota bacterium]|nr:MFS transporter [Pseudomonadota bacterium]